MVRALATHTRAILFHFSRTCDTFAGMGGACSEIDYFPNATIAEYGLIEMDDNVVTNIMTEIFVRGYVQDVAVADQKCQRLS